MAGFREIKPEQITTNTFNDIDRRWLIIGCNDKANNRINAMTASWGAMGILWNKPICILFVRPQRHTFGLIEAEDTLSVSVFDESFRKQLQICGTKSGRDMDKVAECGFTPISADAYDGFAEAEMIMSLKKLYADDLKEDSFLVKSVCDGTYPTKDFHRVYICEIEKVLVKE